MKIGDETERPTSLAVGKRIPAKVTRIVRIRDLHVIGGALHVFTVFILQASLRGRCRRHNRQRRENQQELLITIGSTAHKLLLRNQVRPVLSTSHLSPPRAFRARCSTLGRVENYSYWLGKRRDIANVLVGTASNPAEVDEVTRTGKNSDAKWRSLVRVASDQRL